MTALVLLGCTTGVQVVLAGNVMCEHGIFVKVAPQNWLS